MTSRLKAGVAGLLLAVSLPVWGAEAPGRSEPPKLRLAGHELAARAVQLPVGGKLDLTGVARAGSEETATFQLERFEVFAPDATIIVHGAQGDQILPPPPTRFFRGTLAGDPGSRVFLSVAADGEVSGLVTGRDGAWSIGKAAAPSRAAAGLVMLPASTEAPAGSGFSCDADLLPPPADGFLASLAGNAPAAEPSLPPVQATPQPFARHTVRMAIETDFEYFERFDNTTAATNYAASLVGRASMEYSEEIMRTSFVLQSLSLWTTGADDDPWTQASPYCGLLEFGRYWNTNNTGTLRTLAHFLSGKPTVGGAAWTGVLCRGAFDADAGSCPGLTPAVGSYGGGYGYTSGISGGLGPGGGGGAALWVLYSFLHEVGHNFNSPHTHCYGGIGGNPDPVDTCSNAQCGQPGCHCGPTSRSGSSIMSSCHQLPGGYSNISSVFGAGSVEPERVPLRMRDHVLSTAAVNPSCLALISPPLLSDGFESGSTQAWPARYSNPGGLTVRPGNPPAGGQARYSGNHGLEVAVSSPTPAYLQTHTPISEPEYRVRFYVNLRGLTMAEGDEFELFSAFDGGVPVPPADYGAKVLRIVVRQVGGEKRLSAVVHDATPGAEAEAEIPETVPLPDGWRRVELNWRRDADYPFQLGELQLWVDGIARTGLTGFTNSNQYIHYARWGVVNGVDPGTSGIIRLDDFASRRHDYIGPVTVFTDVATTDPLWPFVHALYNAEVTSGCGGGGFCPNADVTRDQMAVFLLTAEGTPLSSPACTVPLFGDVPCSNPFSPWINELSVRGITGGCGSGNYCPGAAVTRDQMAVFLLRTLEGPAYAPPPCTAQAFNDVPCSNPFSAWINELAARGITGGCGDGDYCPSSPVTRGQMAVFLSTMFGLPVPAVGP